MGAEDKWLNFSRRNLQPVFQSNHSPGFTPAARLYCLNSSLSLQQCLQCWEAAALEATPVTPSRCPAEILWPGPNDPLWEREGPIRPLLFLPAGREGSEGSTAQWGQPSAAALLPPEPQGRAAAHGDKDPVLPGAWSQSLCVGTPTGPGALGAHPLLTSGQELTATGKARTSDSSEMGLYGVYCSKHFIILQWNLLWSAKYYC